MSDSAQRLRAGLRRARAEVLKPRPRLKVWEWSDQNRVIAAGASSSPGRWRTSAQPIGFGPLDAVTEIDTSTITIMAGTQVVKSETLTNIALYFAHQDPCGVLFVQPTQTLAEAFSKERVETSVKVSRELTGLFDSKKSTVAHKQYPGGAIDFVGAHSPTDLSSRPKRVILCDEIDKYPLSAGKEGDPLYLAEERASTFRFDKKLVRVCSPTIKGRSRIEREYEASDQRRAFVECPHCGDEAPLTWQRVQFDKNEAGEIDPTTAGIFCDECGVRWTERERILALKALEHAPAFGWRQTRKFTCCGIEQQPELWDERGRRVCSHCEERVPYDGHAGFHISKIYSARHSLSALVKTFAEARKDPAKWQKFYNTELAETWEETGERPLAAPETLFERRELYGPEDLPEWVRLVTFGTDTQGDRLETTFIGWGADEECAVISYAVTYGDPSILRGTKESPSLWEMHDELISQPFKTASGRVMRARAGCVDSGGLYADTVLRYCRARRMQRIYATKGAAGSRPVFPAKASRFSGDHTGFVIGVDSAKEILFKRLEMRQNISNGDDDENGEQINLLRPRPGFVHFPVSEDFGLEYFEGLLSEEKHTRKRLGQSYTVWVKQPGKRNEPLDTWVLAYAARKSLPARIGSLPSHNEAPDEARYARLAPRDRAEPVEAAVGPVSEAGPAPHSARSQSRSTRPQGFLQRRNGGGWLTPRRS